MTQAISTDLSSIGMNYARWQDAVEAAIASNQLAVTGEVRGGQLIQFADISGAQLNILAVEPFATFAGFDSTTRTYANVTMVTDVVGFCEIIDPTGTVLTSVTANIAQGPLLVDESTLTWQEMGFTILGMDVARYDSVDHYLSETGGVMGTITSKGAEIVSTGAPASPDAGAQFSARVLESEYRTNMLTGEQFIHVSVDGAFPFDVVLPNADTLPERNTVIAGTGVLSGSVMMATGGGCGGGACACGSGGCGGH
nr:hypothetical protein [Corynebacterium sp. CCUG 71335]